MTVNAKALQEQGIKHYQKQEYEEAARVFQQAHEAYMQDGQRDMAAEIQSNLGLVHRALSEYQQALDQFDAALRTFQELGDAFRSAQVLGNMGSVFAKLNDKEQAYNCYEQASEVFLELGREDLYGETLIAIGELQMRDGKLLKGAETYEAALRFVPELTGRQRVVKWFIGMRDRMVRISSSTTGMGR